MKWKPGPYSGGTVIHCETDYSLFTKIPSCDTEKQKKPLFDLFLFVYNHFNTEFIIHSDKGKNSLSYTHYMCTDGSFLRFAVETELIETMCKIMCSIIESISVRQNTFTYFSHIHTRIVCREIICIILKAQHWCPFQTIYDRTAKTTGKEINQREEIRFMWPRQLVLLFARLCQSVADLFALLCDGSARFGFWGAQRRFLLGWLGTRNLLLFSFFLHPPCCCWCWWWLFWFGAGNWFIHLKERRDARRD